MVEYLNIITDLNFNREPVCPWMHICWSSMSSKSGLLFYHGHEVSNPQILSSEFWTWWGPYKLCIWPYIETLQRLRWSKYQERAYCWEKENRWSATMREVSMKSNRFNLLRQYGFHPWMENFNNASIANIQPAKSNRQRLFPILAYTRYPDAFKNIAKNFQGHSIIFSTKRCWMDEYQIEIPHPRVVLRQCHPPATKWGGPCQWIGATW